MQGSKKLPINDLNQYITCQICKGYFVDATTIIECLHTFCRSCIVKYLQANKYCPVCDVQVHKTKPLLNIRPDKTIQDVVYKLVPRLFQNEMQRRRDFYSNHPEAKPTSFEQCGESSYQHLLTPEETVCLTLSYHGSDNKPRYLRCPAAVSIAHLQKLIRAKYALKENHRVDIFYNQDCLNVSLTLMDVAYIYLWKRKGPIELTYSIYECAVKKIKTEGELSDESPVPINCVLNNNFSNNNNNWKEVQLRISENGEMSITGIDTNLDSSLLEIVNSEPKYKNEGVVTMVPTTSVTTDAPRQDKIEETLAKKGNVVPEIPNKTSEPQTINDVQDITNSINTSNLTTVTLNIPLLGISESRTTDVSMQPILSASASLSSATTTTVYSTINESKCSTKSDDTPIKLDQNTSNMRENLEQHTKIENLHMVPISGDSSTLQNKVLEIISTSCNSIPTTSHDLNLKRKCDTEPENEPPLKLAKPNILNHSLQFLNLSNNHPLKKHSKINHNGENVKNSSPKVVILEHSIIEPGSMVTASIKIDVPVSKPITLNKTTTTIHSARSSTPVSVMKTIMSTKASIIPPKLPSTTYVGQKQPCYMPKTTYTPVLNVPKPGTTTNSNLTNSVKSEANSNPTLTSSSSATTSKTDSKVLNINSQQPQHISNSNANPKPPGKAKSATPIGYKTLRDPPKSWNSQISKANFNKSIPDPKYSDLKNVRPKFFKMRNNMPRYLGAPASGVKPMYQVHVSPEKDKPSESNKTEKSEIKKHSIVKIDPKTLKPISEKAPETSSLSNHSSSNSVLPNSHNSVTQNFSTNLSNHSMGNLQMELKINTSSVSIFNPLKLQSSPKNDRRSPKSPLSPKLKSTTSPTISSSSSSKRDKVSVTFTPPNPFVPRLASPTTIGPGQFLYPPPPYDPRVVAAYTSFWYGQRLAEFAGGAAGLPHPGIGLDLNSQITQQQRKNFELLAAAHTAQMASKSMQITMPSISSISRLPNLPPVSNKSSTSSKKKESKNEKSLETTLEKLTQNRHKELTNKPESTDESKSNAEEATKSKPSEKVTPETTGISQTITSNSKTSEIGDTGSHALDMETNKSSEELAGQTKNVDVPLSVTNTTDSPVSISVHENNSKEKSPSHSDVSSENPPTDDTKRSECNDTVKMSQCTENIKTNDESSGSKSAESAERNNDLSDNKNSEKIVEGGE